ncbi:MAG TPA: translation initiation factor IF-2 [Byssovorax sp.]|jgi:translation initiation factor IF-2
MSKVRVYEVAKQLNMDQKALVALFQSMGVDDVRNHMSAVEPDAVERLKRHLERQKTPGGVEERVRADGRVVKRRARPDAVESVRQAPAPEPSQPASRVHADEAPSGRGVAHPPPSAPAAPPSRHDVVEEAPPPPPRSRREAAAPAEAPASKPRAHAAPAAPASEPNHAPPAPPSAREAEPPPRSAAKSHKSPVSAKPAMELFEPEPAPSPVAEVRAAASPPPPPEEPVIAIPPPPLAPAVTPPRAVAAPSPPQQPATRETTSPRSPSTPPGPPKRGVEVWAGRPGVPMPKPAATPLGQRRVMFDPRSNAAPARPGPAGPYRPGMQRGGRSPQGAFQSRRPGAQMPRKPVHVSTQEMSSHKKVIRIEEQVSLQQLASRMSLKATDVLLKLLSMGMTGVNINSTLDADTAKLLSSEFGWTVEDVAVSEDQTLSAATEESDGSESEVRPPIVTVMGHVDHGKTSLLDRIRKASVAEGEAGGITQHIGAYRVDTARGTVAFLDTPGHEAFTAMRARGASATDIVVLVVAADDGVMPQTKEAINHAQAAKVPIIVAVNKIDKPGADTDKIRRDLAALGLQPEDWGGETIFVHVSAKTGEGIDQLLEAILLQAEVLELKANAARRASGVVIEALLDRGRGPVARVMVQDGTLHVGDVLLAGGAWGKVRAMTDELGRPVLDAGPSTPVEVLGLNEVPSAGDPVHAVKDAKTAEEVAETRRKKASTSLIPRTSGITLEGLKEKLAEADQFELKLIIKGDVQGSVEAVGQSLTKLTTQKVKVTIVNAAVGGITEGDVNLAIASKAIIVGFNVRPAGKAASLAESEGIEIRLYTIIYNAVDDIRAAMEGLLPATKIEKILGKAEVRQVFRITKVGIVAGSMVLTGLIRRTAEARLVRDSVVVHTGKLSGLRRFKDDVREVAEGFECGISIEGFNDVKEGDIVESFEIEEVKTKLT